MLIQPQVSDNGYRVFTDKDIALMKKVSMLRKLNINIADIKIIMASKDKCKALADYKLKMELQIQLDGRPVKWNDSGNNSVWL